MKKILIMAMLCSVVSLAQAETPKAAKPAEQSQTEQKAKEQTPATLTPAKESSASNDDTAGFVGTNDFYLALIREGIRRA